MKTFFFKVMGCNFKKYLFLHFFDHIAVKKSLCIKNEAEVLAHFVQTARELWKVIKN